MKKNFKLFCTMCLAGSMAVFSSSCKKSQEKQFVEVTLPAFEEVLGEPSESDKAYIDFNSSGSFHWNGNDLIMVYNICNDDASKSGKAVFEAQTNAEGQPTGKFWYTGDGDDMHIKQDHYYIFYPVNRVDPSAKLGPRNRETFFVPRKQYYSLDPNGNPTVDPEAMAMAGETYDLTNQVLMKHIFGICRLRLKGTAVVDSIKLVGNTDNVSPAAYQNDGLSGQVSLRINAVDLERFNQLVGLYNMANLNNSGSQYFTKWAEFAHDLGYCPAEDEITGKELLLDCHDTRTVDGVDGVQLDASAVTPFYFSVRPGALIHGFDIFVFYHTATNPAIQTAQLSNYKTPTGTGTLNGMKDSYRIKPGTITTFTPNVTIP